MNTAPAIPYGKTTLPTEHGLFSCYAFVEEIDGQRKEALALVTGIVSGQEGVPVRPHSQCITSEVFGSLKCDCKQQLDFALDYITKSTRGVIIYVLEEGRGIGLSDKIRAYALQEQGMDTIEANLAIGHEIDSRRFCIESRVIEALGITSVRLMTNNPEKVRRISEHGVSVKEVINIPVRPTPHSLRYLYTKKDLLGHQFNGLHVPPTP